jgi:hypothetical protein
VKVGEARAAAARWVAEHARDAAWFRGAFLSGSTTWLPDDAALRPAPTVTSWLSPGRTPPRRGWVRSATKAYWSRRPTGDITPLARPIAIDASQQLSSKATNAKPSSGPLADLGITPTAGMVQRAQEALRFLPRLWETAEELLPRR